MSEESIKTRNKVMKLSKGSKKGLRNEIVKKGMITEVIKCVLKGTNWNEIPKVIQLFPKTNLMSTFLFNTHNSKSK